MLDFLRPTKQKAYTAVFMLLAYAVIFVASQYLEYVTARSMYKSMLDFEEINLSLDWPNCVDLAVTALGGADTLRKVERINLISRIASWLVVSVLVSYCCACLLIRVLAKPSRMVRRTENHQPDA
jgi:hypothetical protein